MPLGADDMLDYAQALAFAGNSLLTPMNQTETVGLRLEFWASFPDFDDDAVRAAVANLRLFAEAAQKRSEEGADLVTEVSVEFTKLFVGPPKPAAAPWETFYGAPDGSSVDVGFGQATVQMQHLLQQAGLRMSNDNNQYADHMGIELLYASELARRMADGEDGTSDEGSARDALAAFASEHPLAWIDAFMAAVEDAAPSGYFTGMVALAKALLELA
jgi:TorA maturation chaperone TorD